MNNNIINNSNLSQRSVFVINNTMKSHELFEQSKIITITHNDQEYTMRITANNKLILTK